MKRILFLSKGSDSPSTQYRAIQFFPALRQAGFDPVHHTMAGSAVQYIRALAQARQAHIVVVLRKTFPPPLLWLLRRCARRLVFDFDDAIFANSDGTPSATRMRRFSAIAAVCDHVLAGNAFLASRASPHCAAVTVIPTCIDTAKYDTPTEKPGNEIDLVWIGSTSTRKYLAEATPALGLAARHTKNLKLKIIADFDLPSADIETIPVRWTADGEAAALRSSHIGIAPMADNDWTRGKCALKVLQYMAAGLPVVSSRAGVNAEVVQDGETGFFAQTPDEWSKRIAELAASAELRQQFGDAGRKLVDQRYAMKPVASSLSDVLQGLS